MSPTSRQKYKAEIEKAKIPKDAPKRYLFKKSGNPIVTRSTKEHLISVGKAEESDFDPIVEKVEEKIEELL